MVINDARARAGLVIGATLLLAACDSPLPPPEPTWAHVEPLLRAHCNHCHGATADRTGSASGVVYRFDFYDTEPDRCGEAASVLSEQSAMARAWAALIKSSVTSKDGGRPRMPPAPASQLADWERETLVRWADLQAPRGMPRANNRPPQIKLDTRQVDRKISVHATVSDPDGQSVVGVLKLGPQVLRMDRAGSFAATVDARAWADGKYPISAVLCDGWVMHQQVLGDVQIGTPPATPDAAAPDAPPDAAAPDASAPVDAGASDAAPLDAGGEAPLRCPDLDDNGKLDCDENLLVNAGFEQDLRGWVEEKNTAQAFVSRDGQGRAGSGAIAVINAIAAEDPGSTLAGSGQCVEAMPKARYQIRAQVLVEAGQSGSDSARAAGVNIRFWSAPGCAGDFAGAAALPLAPEAPFDVWRLVSGQATAPAQAKSMTVRLVAAKSFKQPPFRVLVDIVLVRIE